MTVMKAEIHECIIEQLTLKKEQAYIRRQLGVPEDVSDTASDTAASSSGHEGYMSSCDELDEESNKPSCPRRATSVMSSDGGYVSSSDEDKPNKSVSFVIDLTQEKSFRTDFRKFPSNFQQIFGGVDIGIPDDCNVPIYDKPAWLDMKKFKIGQKFAQDNYFGLNYAEMISLIFLFALPDGVQPLIYTGKSDTPFTAFRRYLSTVLRVKSWFEDDVWTKDTLGYKNLKTVRAMHLNVSKRLNSVPYNELKDQLTLLRQSKEKAIWSSLTDNVLEDFQSGCPFHGLGRPIPEDRPGKVFLSQYDMSITQFGFIGLMITYPEKFGAANATDEELDGFVHLWRGLGYLLGIEDKYNFCSGTLEEVRSRCLFVIKEIVNPSLQMVTKDWEHMSRCMVEGVSYYTPGLHFEESLLYLCWVVDVPTPSITSAISSWHIIMFYLIKLTMCFTLRLPGMRPLHNWLVRRSLVRASSWSAKTLQKLESKIYDYEKQGTFNTRL